MYRLCYCYILMASRGVERSASFVVIVVSAFSIAEMVIEMTMTQSFVMIFLLDLLAVLGEIYSRSSSLIQHLLLNYIVMHT